MRRVTVIDPGIRGCGVARFVTYDSAERALDASQMEVLAPSYLLHAAYVRNEAKAGNGPDECLQMALAIKHAGVQPDDIVFEWPRIYTQGKRAGDPNDLLPLVGVCMAYVGLFPCATSRAYFPRDWKGSVGKEVMNERVLSRLTPSEKNAIVRAGALTHNVLDAIGIGLHHIGRLTPRRVIAR